MTRNILIFEIWTTKDIRYNSVKLILYAGMYGDCYTITLDTIVTRTVNSDGSTMFYEGIL